MAHNMKLLETLTVSRVMQQNVVSVNIEERISSLRFLLKETGHNGFPVVSESKEGTKVYVGFITRDHLQVVLRSAFYKLSSFDSAMKNMGDNASDLQAPKLVLDLEISFEELNKKYVSERARSLLRMHDEIALSERMGSPLSGSYDGLQAKGPEGSGDHKNFENVSINLRPFVNTSAVAIQMSFSVARTYILFRTLGLRHLTVVNDLNEVAGIVTRKDLIAEKLDAALRAHRQDAFA